MEIIPDFKKILISRLRFMGDIILTTPVIEALSQAYPEAELAYLAESAFIALLENHPHIKTLIPFDLKSWQQFTPFKKFRAHSRFLMDLRRRHFDLALDLFGNPRSAVQIWASGARYRIGGDFPGRGKLYNIRINYRQPRLNAMQFHLHALKPLGIPLPAQPRTRLFTRPAEDAEMLVFLRQLGLDPQRPMLGIHPGASWPAKMWLLERFVELIHLLQKNANFQIVLTHGPGEEKRIEQINALLQSPVFVPPVLQLRKLAALLKQMTVFVCNDCGPLHLAVAVGTKTLGIFGPGEPDIWFPYASADGHRYLHRPPACWPCHRDFCDDLQCMKNITAPMVHDTIQSMLADSNLT